MDQIKIGRFISEKRKEKKLTQAQLAERLGITDRAVSKWETGKSLPDAAIMLELCGLLCITVNDLLCGEVVSMENYNERTEKNLVEMVRQKEDADRRLLVMEIVIGAVSILFAAAMLAVAMLIEMPDIVKYILIGVGFVQFIVAMMFGIRIEQTAGYYECRACGHRYVPGFGSVLFAMHINRTRFMKCPRCGKRSWQKKVIGEKKSED